MIVGAILLLVSVRDLRRLLPCLPVLVIGSHSRRAVARFRSWCRSCCAHAGLGGPSRKVLVSRTLVVVLTAALIYQWLPSTVTARYTSFSGAAGTAGAYAIDIRNEYAHDAEQLIAAHPWIGVGVGNYLAGNVAQDTVTTDPNDVILLEAAEGGYLFAASFILLIAGLAFALWRLRRVVLAPTAVAVVLPRPPTDSSTSTGFEAHRCSASCSSAWPVGLRSSNGGSPRHDGAPRACRRCRLPRRGATLAVLSRARARGAGHGRRQLVLARSESRCDTLRCRLRRRRCKRGFAAGVNIALSRLANDDVDVLLLNPDAVLTPGAVRELSRFLHRPERRRVAAVAPRLFGPGGEEQRVSWPFPTPLRMCAEAAGSGGCRRATRLLWVRSYCCVAKQSRTLAGSTNGSSSTPRRPTGSDARLHKAGRPLFVFLPLHSTMAGHEHG